MMDNKFVSREDFDKVKDYIEKEGPEQGAKLVFASNVISNEQGKLEMTEFTGKMMAISGIGLVALGKIGKAYIRRQIGKNSE